MRVGVIKEMKDKEHRVALTPAGTTALQQAVVPALPMRNTWQPGQPWSL
jgi:alanine dehydrogenase